MPDEFEDPVESFRLYKRDLEQKLAEFAVPLQNKREAEAGLQRKWFANPKRSARNIILYIGDDSFINSAEKRHQRTMRHTLWQIRVIVSKYKGLQEALAKHIQERLVGWSKERDPHLPQLMEEKETVAEIEKNVLQIIDELLSVLVHEVLALRKRDWTHYQSFVEKEKELCRRLFGERDKIPRFTIGGYFRELEAESETLSRVMEYFRQLPIRRT